MSAPTRSTMNESVGLGRGPAVGIGTPEHDLHLAMSGCVVPPRRKSSVATRAELAAASIVEMVACTYRGTTSRALQLSHEIERLLPSVQHDLPPSYLAAYALACGAVNSIRLDFGSSREDSRHALQLARLAHNQDLVVSCHLQAARDAYQSGNMSLAIELLAKVNARSDVSPHNTALMHGYLAELCSHYQLWASVDQYLAMATQAEHGFGEISRARFCAAHILTLQFLGRREAANRLLTEIRTVDEASASSFLDAELDAAESMLCASAGDLDRADRLSARAVEVMTEHGNFYHLCLTLRMRASVVARLGRLDEASALLDQSDSGAMGKWSCGPLNSLRSSIARSRGHWKDVARLHRERLVNDRESDRDVARLYTLLARYRHDQDLHRNARALQETNRRLGLAYQERERLLHIVAHDLKSPLSALDLTLAGLASNAGDDDRVSKKLASATEIAQRIQEISGQLNALHDLESAAFAVECDEVDLIEVLTQVVRHYESAARQKRIQLSLQSGGARAKSVMVRADRSKLLQILENLISNALKYSPRLSSVSISVGDVDSGARFEQLRDSDGNRINTVEMRIRDAGDGLSERDLELVFGKYAKLSSKPTGGESSSGVGLYIADSFASAMGGKLLARSEGKGKGSTFALRLPAGLDPAPDIAKLLADA